MRKQLRVSQSVKWLVDWAPAPSDIFWENLGIAKPCWYLNALLINVALGVVLFFVTTPAVSNFNKQKIKKNVEKTSNFKIAVSGNCTNC